MSAQTWFPDFITAVEQILGEPISNFDYVEISGIEHRVMKAMPSVRIAFDNHDTPEGIAGDLLATREGILTGDPGEAYMVTVGNSA